MKIGLFDPILWRLDFEAMLDKVRDLGLDAVEISTGGYVGSSHCDVKALIGDANARSAWKGAIDERGLTISALSCHGNPLHPDPAVADDHHGAWRDTVVLAELLGVDTVVTFSGCPGGGPDDKTPAWHVCAWPTDHAKSLEWQWAERVIPYWREQAEYADSHGVKVAIEMHPGFVVYHPENALLLRNETRANVGVNFDPSHLFWQRVDIARAIRRLGDSIYHFHAKDTRIDPIVADVKGVLDTTPYNEVADRSWVFRSVGYGHDVSEWKTIVSALRTVGYDGVLSIEHEDALASPDEGLAKAVSALREAVLTEPAGKAFWAE
ncbi:sugar phosphate isomerase/epimerase family protein [Bauldia sp.]|uniref:sugar phosphate isomerase/epimerase family protein n=1 Tax=Bauldia sp. TaxID=2575872 RepID=UPI003BA8A05A